MIIVYYTKNGEVIKCHTGKGKSYFDLLEMADNYNKYNEDKAHIRLVDDNSLEAYLMESFEKKRKAVTEIIQALNKVEDKLDNMWSDEE